MLVRKGFGLNVPAFPFCSSFCSSCIIPRLIHRVQQSTISGLWGLIRRKKMLFEQKYRLLFGYLLCLNELLNLIMDPIVISINS